MTEGRQVGTVVSIARYPVKSMGAESLEAATLHWPWLLGDRQYAFVKATAGSDFPWLTARDLPSLVRFTARYDKPDDPTHGTVVVTDPDGAAFDIHDPALATRLSEAAGVAVRLLRLGRGCFDAMPVSVLTTTMAAAIGRAHGAELAVERFRANLLLEPDEAGTTEQDWLGRSIMFGAAGTSLDVGWATPRCAMVGIDPATAAQDPAVIRTVARRFGNRVGVYCSVRQPGPIRRGDPVRLSAGPDHPCLTV